MVCNRNDLKGGMNLTFATLSRVKVVGMDRNDCYPNR